MSKGRELKIVGAAAEKLLEPKHVRTRGTDNRLPVVSDVCTVHTQLTLKLADKYEADKMNQEFKLIPKMR